MRLLSIALRPARVAAALAALALGLPARASAQLPLIASASCAPGVPACGVVRFDFTFAAAPLPPLSLATLRFDLLTPGWSFAGGPAVTVAAGDLFGPFPAGLAAEVRTGGTPTAGGTALFIDLMGQGSSFELLPGSSGWVEVAVTAGSVPLRFAFEGVDLAGESVTGTGGAVTTTPEPASVLLLGAGLALLLGAGVRARRVA